MSSGEESNISSYYLDEKAFHLCCKLFLQHSGVIRDGWSWAEVKGGEEGYIKKTAIMPGRFCSLPNHKADDGMSALTGAVELDDEAAGGYSVCESQVLMHYEYHVLYSFSHQVPILYFRASTLDGQPLSLHEVWSNIHPNYRQRLLQGPWDALTQQEHPLLGQPFFMLHPCHTEEFMRPLFKMAHAKKRKVNYIATWLSVVGPVVGLDVPLSYHTALIAPD
ncbi:ubiquitin-like-conjugating enzyme ATG10 isoform X2 [Pangasianodon hypophthalmus]|nr:ubiquitin-like-conjugating enzyme ATG10 isoform X2 [Pangasianodon hypophthalmus]XP_034168355.2 ubiquitin-like-conjugating enzyme ATG10 isoform X2 [Pangasianodon hypophthalmus]XP_034168357.2 ubiquitin-like-conjugating enzyme ATG10 isoform X2 [Pangasianodon hypophthalmus]XP_034168360.2 ubiquitin-like-conjugating enzyme ATG10 isoform X2 [Pangasianodon hypophthalmus]